MACVAWGKKQACSYLSKKREQSKRKPLFAPFMAAWKLSKFAVLKRYSNESLQWPMEEKSITKILERFITIFAALRE